MVQTLNFISLSSQQAPNDVDWPGLVKAGVQGALIRLGHGIIRDPCASGHIAKAKQYGLYWHGYHTYEGVVNEPQFTIKNATDLGLSNSQYYFVDLAKSSDPFNDYYALHATWLSQGYSTGLLISNDDYLSKFKDSEVIASGTLRWLISDTEPADYDVWQYSSEGTIGTSSVKVGFNFAKTDKLKYNLSTTLTGADINKDPYNPQTPVGGAYIGWGYDTTGLGGGKTIGYSTNGKNFYALISPNGLVVRKSDGNRIYGTIADQIDSAISANVIPAKSAADSAVAYANDAVEKSKVNSQAIDDINSAVSDAVSDAAVARSDGLRAWNAAQSNVNLIDLNYASASAAISSARTEAIAAADEAKSSASAAQADIVVVKSSVAAVQADVTATKSDVAVAKSDIADTKTNLTIQAKSLASYAAQASAEYASTASALSDAKTEFSSDVAEAKNLASTAQTTADNAVKSASSVADNLTAVASQAKANSDGITKVTSDVGLLQTTVANNTGDISTIQETAKQIQQSVSDNAGNITVAKQTADSAVAVASDAKSNATVAIQTASQASITAQNASGQAASAVLTANGAMTTASDAKSDATVAIQTASGASLTATNAQGDASIAKQTASEAKVQASNAESDFAQLSVRANKIETNVANNSGAIANVQQTANGLTTTVADIKANGGGVNLLTGTSGDLQTKQFTNSWNVGPQATNGNYKIKLVKGQTYTYRAWLDNANTNANSSDHVFVNVRFTPIGGTNFNLGNGTFIEKGETGYSTLVFTPSEDGYANFVPFAYGTPQTFLAGWKEEMLENGTVAHDWSPAPEDLQNQFTQIKQSIDGVTTTINDPKTGLNATYQTASGNSTTISNIQGDVSQLKVSASSASVALSDAAGNISSLQATASELETKYADAAGDISTLQADAKGMTQTISNAQGDIAKLKTRADGFDTQFANINGDINKIQTNATGVTQTLTNAKSDIAVLQSRADGFDAKYATAAGDINTLKANASGFSQTLTNAQGDISTLKSTVSGVQTTLTDAQGNISTLQSDVSGLKKTTSDNAGNISTLQATANTLTSQMSSAQGDISTLKQTASGISSQVSGMSRDLNNLKSQAQWVTVTDTVDLNNIKTPCHEFLKGTVTNAPNETAWWYLTVEGSEGNRITQTVIADQSNNRYTRRFADSWSAWIRDATRTDVTALSGQITANTTQITQNKQAIALKADQTTVDNTNGTVQKLQSQLQVQAGQIATKVSSSDLDAKGYATQTYTQTQIKQTSDTWNANLTKLQNDTKTALTNLSIGVEGVQAQVYNSDGSSKITQLSNLISTKVSSDDFNSLSKSVNLQTLDSADINNMKTNGHYFVHNLANNPIGGWVYVDVTGNGNDRIRQDVYQDNGTKHKYRRLYGTSWTGWEEGATYTEINQLQDAINLRVTKGDLISQINLQAGTALIQSNKLVLDAGTTVFTGEAFIPSAAISSISADKVTIGSSSLYNSDGTLNLVNSKDGTTSKITVTQGNVDFDGTEKNASVIHFASDNNTNAFTITPVGATVTPTLFFERFDQTPGHWLGFTRNQIRYEGVEFHTWDDDGERFGVDCHARFNRNIRVLGTFSQGSWNGTTAKPEAGVLTIKNGNTIWSGSNFLAIGDNLSNSYTNVMAKSFSQQSTLSSKTNIEEVDPKDALDLVNRTDIRSYQYTSDVEQGKTKRYTSLIIDDVNDVSKYYAPNEFTNEERTGRDDGSAVGYLFLAVKELTKRIENLEEKLNG